MMPLYLKSELFKIGLIQICGKCLQSWWLRRPMQDGMFEASLSKLARPCLKIKIEKRRGGLDVAQVQPQVPKQINK